MIRELGNALDDPVRAVRKEAVECRAKWYVLSHRSSRFTDWQVSIRWQYSFHTAVNYSYWCIESIDADLYVTLLGLNLVRGMTRLYTPSASSV